MESNNRTEEMKENPFLIPFDKLPTTIPLFPLAHAVVMPGCHLPLNIFEPRYLTMVGDTLKKDRLIGMILPEETLKSEGVTFKTGTAGRIISFNETPDGKILIILSGVCRFDIVKELDDDHPYRTAEVSWGRFQSDYEAASDMTNQERERLFDLLRSYFGKKGYQTDWNSVEELPTNLLVNALTGQLPLETRERQALIESISPTERLDKLIHLLEFDVADSNGTLAIRH